MANRGKHAPADVLAGTASWNNSRQQHISNDSSLGGDEFYDAVEDVSSRAQRMSGISSSVYGSNRSSRTRSSSAGNLVPNAEAAELMKVVASTNSSTKLDVSAFATPGEYAEEGPGSSSLALDGSHRAGRSKNPFSEEATAGGGGATEYHHVGGADTAAETRRRWLSSGPLQPAKMVVEDISSAENTPVNTPVRPPGVEMGDGGGGGGSGTVNASLVPPPRPPPRGDNSTTRAVATTAAANLNPFAEEKPLSPTSPTANPFVTASSTLNPFAESGPQQAGPDGGDGDDGDTSGQREEGEGKAPLPPTARGPGAVSALSLGDAGAPLTVTPASPAAAAAAAAAAAGAATASSAGSNPKKPPPLPPRRAASPSPPTHQQQPPASRARAATDERRDEDSGPISPRSTTSIATCTSSGGHAEGGADTASVGSSTGSDGAAGGKAKKKYMVVNKDTGQKFDVRTLEEHLPADSYALLPSRNDLIELEKRRSANGATSSSSNPAPDPTSHVEQPSVGGGGGGEI